MQNAFVRVISKVVSGVADAVFGMPGDKQTHRTLDDLRDRDGVVHVPLH
jgi:hypothetical protein